VKIAVQRGPRVPRIADAPQDAFARRQSSQGAIRLTRRQGVPGGRKFSKSLLAGFLLLLFYAPHSRAQTATISWNNVDQVIDGFGAARTNGSSMSTSQQALFFGTTPPNLGFSIYRTAVTNGDSDESGSCSTINTGCAGPYVSDMQAEIAAGGRIYASPWSPPAAYKTNGSVTCTAGSGNGALAPGSYANYATWLANFVRSLAAQGVSLYALSVQNEPDICPSYDGAVWTAAQLDTFIKTNLGPTFSSEGLSTLIFTPENSGYGALTGDDGGTTCMEDSSCAAFVGGVNWHDYDVRYSAPDTVSAASYPSGWATGKQYWETEVSSGSGFGPNAPGCSGGEWCPSIADALMWAAIIDDRMVNEGANAWLYWWLITPNNDNEGLVLESTGAIAKRAYVMGQYSQFVRPGFNRIDATHAPQGGVTVSAYKNPTTGAFAIVATNQNSSSVTQAFTFNGASPTSVTPFITSSTLNIAAQSSVSLTAGAFTYTLPASSVTTFVGSTSTVAGPPPPPKPPTGLTATIR
jgi:glucuronoarabinoxylan endo-1,4-beta-xylanase